MATTSLAEFQTRVDQATAFVREEVEKQVEKPGDG
jgi:hypothetical protein